MNHKHIFLGVLGILGTAITIPAIASNYDDIPLTPGQIQFIKLIDSQAGTKFSSLIDTPNSNRIITAATFACGNVDFQKKFLKAAGANNATSVSASNTFEKLFCDHLNIKGH
jgi:hypothetical protein